MASGNEGQSQSRVEYTDEREWADWWQSYWSDAPERPRQPERTRPRPRYPWRESAHEFDFGGEQ
jgi:hypothetical protein